MHTAAEERRLQILAETMELARERLPAAMFEAIEPYLAHYYAQVGEDQVAARGVADLYGAAVSHWQFARRFVPGTAASVRVYNPRIEEHGWQSRHTVVEIVNDDMPFLVDSVTMEINRLGLTLHAAIHPVLRVWRDDDGVLRTARPAAEATDPARPGGRLESHIHMEIDRCTEPERLEQIRAGIVAVLGDVRVAVEDWPQMVQAARQAAQTLAELARDVAEPARRAEIDEAHAFVQWLAADHFTFLGCRDYALLRGQDDNSLQGEAGTGLGLLRESRRAAGAPDVTRLPAGAQRVIDSGSPVFLTKANSRSTVHRPGHLDYVGVKRYDPQGQVVGERRFLGLYTSTAYMGSTADIPLVRRKAAAVMARAGFVPRGHLAKTLATILEQYPRDELFQIGVDELYDTAQGILRLEEHQRTRLFVRRDPFGRFASCLVFVPRDKYNTELRQRVQALLAEAFDGASIEFTPLLSESVLARLHMIVWTRAGAATEVDVATLEARIVQAARRWQDDLADALLESVGEERGTALLRRYGAAFPVGFREDTAARAAVRDIELAERALAGGGLAMTLYRPLEAAPDALRFKVYRVGGPVPLSRSLPMLEHMGVVVADERPYRIEPAGAPPVWLHDFGMQLATAGEVDIDRIKALFEQAYARVWARDAENDDFNRLVLRARLDWRQVTVLRAYAKYLRQAGSTFSNAYIERALVGNPDIARLLVALFEARFDPAQAATGTPAGDARVQALQAEVAAALERVPNLDEDRILRQFLGAIDATIRTNYFQRGADGGPKPYLSFKFDPARMPGLPEPRPMFEIWVYGTRFEGVHLRGGRVARGGLRWSDRREDFRTEVLGLVKAQMVKNTVIVPVGSKGGFVLKEPPAGGDRDALLAEGVDCYRMFLRGLLDLTDNRVGEAIVPPPDVVRLDADDPYLVVAADKGTASFSDYANAVSADYGFWLGDAFASGGSVGYDHKRMAITARGAWEAVKRRFRELGTDVQREDFTVAGIGDMSGDVFGNGMLLSPHIRLVAAFDHRHVFLDPDPDPATSLAERRRLFGLARSSWADYDISLISAGGGVFARTAKSIALSPQVRAALAVDAAELSPAELIRAILLAPVDLLYNGGIGTYVKSARETDAQAGDRANDAVRVDGGRLRCKVVAEGGNLGFTQLGRIEYAMTGGRIGTDAIDNSAGVDCSDHEVNIKILLGIVMADGEMTEKQRNQLLATMTDEVAALVLADNYHQTQALSVAARHAAALLEPESRLMRFLERAGRLDRAVEFLPTDEDLAERKAARRGLTTPERAVLLAYAKMWLYDELLASALPEEPFIAQALVDYFPQPLRQTHRDAMQRHPLRREIIATQVCNALVNRAGATFVHRLTETTGAAAAQVVHAAVAAREIFGLDGIWRDIDSLDNQVPDALQAHLLTDVGILLQRATQWLLRSGAEAQPIEALVSRLRPAAEQLGPRLAALMAPADAQAIESRRTELEETGVPAELARRAATAAPVLATLDVAEVAAATGRPLELVAQVYFALDARLQLAWIRTQAAALPAETHWQALARSAMQGEAASLQRALALAVLTLSPQLDDAQALLDAWQADERAGLDRYKRLLADLQAAGSFDLAMLAVVVRQLRAIGAG